MRTLSSAGQAALLRSPLPLAALVEMDLTQPLYLNTGGLDLVLNGVTYYGTKGLGAIGAVQDTPAEMRGLEFTLAGVQPSLIALALSEPVQGKAVRIKLAVFNPDDATQLLDTVLLWAGRLDAMGIDDSPQ